MLVVNYRMIPKHSVGEALDDCYDAYKWLRLKGYEPDQIVLAGDSAGGYLALALAERLQAEGEEARRDGHDVAAVRDRQRSPRERTRTSAPTRCSRRRRSTRWST